MLLNLMILVVLAQKHHKMFKKNSNPILRHSQIISKKAKVDLINKILLKNNMKKQEQDSFPKGSNHHQRVNNHKKMMKSRYSKRMMSRLFKIMVKKSLRGISRNAFKKTKKANKPKLDYIKQKEEYALIWM